jgi:hypothetical protein
MRARNLKPALFKNEILGTSDPLYTILFEGLWCLADRAGRLEDRALRIKAEVFPYRDGLDIDALLLWLHNLGFIVRYVVGGVRLIQIIKFLEHQSPHKNEVPSVLPELDRSGHNQGSDKARPKTAPLALTPSSLTPDSGLLTPDSLVRESTTKVESGSGQGSNSPRESEAQIHQRIMHIKAKWPQGGAYEDWITAEKLIRNLVTAGDSWDVIQSGVERYAKLCKATRRIIANPAKWFAEIGRPWLAPWTIPPKNGEKPAPNHDAEWAEAKSRAKAIEFRDPYPSESASVYATMVKLAENTKPAVPIAERIGLAGIKRIGAT